MDNKNLRASEEETEREKLLTNKKVHLATEK